MRKIPLTQGKFALVDDKDFERFGDFKWQYMNGYAGRTVYMGGGRKGAIYTTEWLHRLIAEVPEGMVGDHINGDTLDNQRSNLRICTQRQNLMNTGKKSTNTSGVKGVSWHKASKKWVAQIYIDGKKRHLGIYSDINEAKRIYQNSAEQTFGIFARKEV